VKQIRYKRYTEEELDKVREILGIQRGYKVTDPLSEETAMLLDKDTEVAEALDLDPHEAYSLVANLIMGSKVSGHAEDAEAIDITVLGDELPREAGGVLAHEIGHIRDREVRGEGAMQENPILMELVAIYYSYYTSGDKELFDKHMKATEWRSKRRPELLRGMTFAEAKNKATNIARKELGAKSPEERSHARTTSRRRNGGSHTSLKGIR